MRVDKEFKANVDEEFREADYVGRKVLGRWILIVVLLVVIFGGIGFAYKKVYVDANREIFKIGRASCRERV